MAEVCALQVHSPSEGLRSPRASSYYLREKVMFFIGVGLSVCWLVGLFVWLLVGLFVGLSVSNINQKSCGKILMKFSGNVRNAMRNK